MKLLLTSSAFPFSTAAIYSGYTLKTVLMPILLVHASVSTALPDAELRKNFRQLDEVLQMVGFGKKSVVSSRLYLQGALRNVAEVDSDLYPLDSLDDCFVSHAKWPALQVQTTGATS